MKKEIDFLIIGAMKSGTTSLFRYLQGHSQIFMVPGKEVVFFSNNNNFSKGLDWYINQHFDQKRSFQLWGEASPQYMCFDYVPKRIYSLFPNVKLIAILRNPIDRAFSHYRMAKRREKVNSSFEVCIQYLIRRGKTSDEKNIDLEKEFIMFGEYGRILLNYLNYFSKKNIKIVFTENLRDDPIAVMKEIYNFLNIQEEFKMDVIGKRFHVGGEKRFMNIRNIIMNNRRYFRRIVPLRIRRSFRFWLETQFIVKPVEPPALSMNIRNILKDYYRQDVALLEKTFNIKVPWTDFN